MPLTVFEEIHDESTKQKIRAHFAPDIARLQALGFKEEVYGREVAFPLSALAPQRSLYGDETGAAWY